MTFLTYYSTGNHLSAPAYGGKNTNTNTYGIAYILPLSPCTAKGPLMKRAAGFHSGRSANNLPIGFGVFVDCCGYGKKWFNKSQSSSSFEEGSRLEGAIRVWLQPVRVNPSLRSNCCSIGAIVSEEMYGSDQLPRVELVQVWTAIRVWLRNCVILIRC